MPRTKRLKITFQDKIALRHAWQAPWIGCSYKNGQVWPNAGLILFAYSEDGQLKDCSTKQGLPTDEILKRVRFNLSPFVEGTESPDEFLRAVLGEALSESGSLSFFLEDGLPVAQFSFYSYLFIFKMDQAMATACFTW